MFFDIVNNNRNLNKSENRILENWDNYVLKNNFGYRLGRLLFSVLIYSASCWFVISNLGPFPSPPARGPWSLGITGFILGVSVISSICLILYVLDATRQCRKFIISTADKSPVWPNESYEKYLYINRMNQDDHGQNVNYKEKKKPLAELRVSLKMH